MFDALSFWIMIHERETNRTFAALSDKHHAKYLDGSQHQAYRDRLERDARMVQVRFNLNNDELFEFLSDLLRMYRGYRGDERYKLSDELRQDAIYLARLLATITGLEWEDLAMELGERGGDWTKETLRHLDIATKERDEASKLLTYYAGQYEKLLTDLKISTHAGMFSDSEIDELLTYCQRNGLSILLTALSGMATTQEDIGTKFRRVSQYTNLRSALTALEYVLKSVGKNPKSVAGKMFNETVKVVMKSESGWINLFLENKHLTRADSTTQFFANLNEIMNNQELVQSEDTYWARVFLTASLARNLTAHYYPNDDWFYAEMLGEMVRAAIYALLYSWQKAIKKGGNE